MMIKKKNMKITQRIKKGKKKNSELERSTDRSKPHAECETETDATGRLSRPFQKYLEVFISHPY